VPEFQELWREYVAAFSELIRQADHDARSAAAMHLVGRDSMTHFILELDVANAGLLYWLGCVSALAKPPVKLWARRRQSNVLRRVLHVMRPKSLHPCP